MYIPGKITSSNIVESSMDSKKPEEKFILVKITIINNSVVKIKTASCKASAMGDLILDMLVTLRFSNQYIKKNK